MSFFSLLEIPEEQNMDIAAMHLEGKTKTWFDGYILQKHIITWQEFSVDLCHKFCDRTYTDVIEEFNKLVQKTSVEEYQEKIEELQLYIIQKNPYQDEAYFMSSFLSELKEELRQSEGTSILFTAGSMHTSKLHELSIEIEIKKLGPKTYPSNLQAIPQKTWNPPTPNLQKTSIPNSTQTNHIGLQEKSQFVLKIW
ncbi:hypothetical protein GQ457_15G015360 [Hibiscus cannabinus]